MSSFWPSSTSEYRFLGTKLTIDSYSYDSSTPPPYSERAIYCGQKFRVVAALIRTDKQNTKEELLCSEPCGEEYKTSGMYWRVLDDEEAAAN